MGMLTHVKLPQAQIMVLVELLSGNRHLCVQAIWTHEKSLQCVRRYLAQVGIHHRRDPHSKLACVRALLHPIASHGKLVNHLRRREVFVRALERSERSAHVAVASLEAD